MRIVFCIYDFVSAKLPLQPWLTICLVAEGLARRGHSVHVVSDVIEPARISGVETHTVNSLRGSNAAEMRALLATLRPDALVFLPTPLNIATAFWLDGLSCRCIGFASYPFYNASELMTAVRCIGLADVKQYLRHLLVPEFIWVRAMRRRMHALIAQSATTAVRLESAFAGKPASLCIAPGMDLAQWPYLAQRDKTVDAPLRLLYLGAAIAIRGFDVALDALAQVRDERVHLRVLARDADASAVAAIQSATARRGLGERVEVEGGWIDRARLIEEIHAADAVLQPFVLVPSELPVTAMEMIACGTPVIGSDIDGLPSTIGPAGTVVKQGSSAALAEAIMNFAQSAQLRAAWRAGCRQQREAMLDWGAVTERWEVVLHG